MSGPARAAGVFRPPGRRRGARRAGGPSPGAQADLGGDPQADEGGRRRGPQAARAGEPARPRARLLETVCGPGRRHGRGQNRRRGEFGASWLGREAPRGASAGASEPATAGEAPQPRSGFFSLAPCPQPRPTPGTAARPRRRRRSSFRCALTVTALPVAAVPSRDAPCQESGAGAAGRCRCRCRRRRSSHRIGRGSQVGGTDL